MKELSISCGISGFENPTLPYLRKPLSLTNLFVHSPSSMRLISSPTRCLESGIEKNDWLLIDAALTPLLSDMVLIQLWEDFVVLKWSTVKTDQNATNEDALLLGVITLSVHHFRTPPALPDHDNLLEIDLHRLLVEQEHSTLLCRAQGDSMKPFVRSNDILILERQLDAIDHDAVILALNHDLIMKRLDRANHLLYSDNPNFKPYRVTNDDYIRLHGVVRTSLRFHRTPVKC